MRIFFTGATGFIGSNTVRRLFVQGHQVVAITRSKEKLSSLFPKEYSSQQLQIIEGDPKQKGNWQNEIKNCEVIIALAGEPVFGRRWNSQVKKQIEESRIQSMARLVEAVRMIPASQRPKKLLSASAIGYYGNKGDQFVNENTLPGTDFLAQVCKKWEKESEQASEYGVQVIPIRIGLVLSPLGGVLKQLLPFFRIGLGGTLGSGNQYFSWIALDDLINIIEFCLQLSSEMTIGPINATTPNPVTMNEFVQTLGRTLHRPSFFRVPRSLLQIAFGESAFALVTGQRVLPTKLQALGFAFQHSQLQEALYHLFATFK